MKIKPGNYKMMRPYVCLLVLLTTICSCSDTPSPSVDTAAKSTHPCINIQNSLPKGGTYAGTGGKIDGYRIFWARVLNDTTVPVELTVHFPADSIALPQKPGLHLRLFLPPDTMTHAKESDYDYGARGLKHFIDTGLNKPRKLQTIIQPKEEYLFYVGALIHPDVLARAKLCIDEQDKSKISLSYAISVGLPINYIAVPCGQIVFKK